MRCRGVVRGIYVVRCRELVRCKGAVRGSEV